MTSDLSPTRLFSPSNPPAVGHYSPVQHSAHSFSSSRHTPNSPSGSPFSSPSKYSAKSRVVSSPFRAPLESDDEEEDNTIQIKEGISSVLASPYYYENLSPNRFAAPDLDADDDDEDDNLEDITESSLNIHGSFLPTENYDYNSNEQFNYDISNTPATPNPYPFSFQTYDTYLRSPLRSSPLRSPSQWDDEEENKGCSQRTRVEASPSRLISPNLLYLLDDLTLTPKREPPKPTTPQSRTMVAGYLALSKAVRQETARELEYEEDAYAVELESSLLRRKNDSIKHVAKLKEEDTTKERIYQETLADISLERRQYIMAIKQKIEQDRQEEIRRKDEEDRKKAEEQRILLEALERKRIAEETQRKKEEDERRRKEEAERKQREEAERKRAEEERIAKEEIERKRKEEEQREQEKRLEEQKRQEEETSKLQEEERKRQEEAEKLTREQQSRPEASTAVTTNQEPSSPLPASLPASPQATSQAEKEKRKESKKYISPEATEEYQNSIRTFKGIMQTVQALEANPAFNDIKKRVTMEINLKIGQLSPDSAIVRARTADVINLCQEAAAHNDAVFLFSLNLFAVKMMRQTALMEKPQNVFPLATMAVALMQRFPSMVSILIAKFYTYCPFTLPRYPRRKVGQSELEYRKSMGYLQIEDNPPKLEDDAAFYARMEGAVRLYATIIQSQLGGPHPHGLAHGWKWLARIANLPPVDITVTVLRVFLEIAGHELLKMYKVQFHKLMVYFLHDFLPQCPSAARPSDHSRLLKFLQSYLQTGQLSPPPGRDFT